MFQFSGESLAKPCVQAQDSPFIRKRCADILAQLHGEFLQANAQYSGRDKPEKENKGARDLSQLRINNKVK